MASSAGKLGRTAEIIAFKTKQPRQTSQVSFMLSVLEHAEFTPDVSPCVCQEQQCPFQDDLSSFLSPLSCNLDFETTGETSPVS